MKGNVYGYVRVSTKEQNEGGQEAFRGAGYLSENRFERCRRAVHRRCRLAV